MLYVPPGMTAPAPPPVRDDMERFVLGWDHVVDTSPVGSVEYRWSEPDRKWFTRALPLSVTVE